MQHEQCFETNLATGQLRIPKDVAIANHIAQYETRSMAEGNGRRNAVNAIEQSLGIREPEDSNHNCNSINMTEMLIRSGRRDLAIKVWKKPSAFKSANLDLWSLGLQRIEVELFKDQPTDWGKQISNDWTDALSKIDVDEK